jgi:hypothetical protein
LATRIYLQAPIIRIGTVHFLAVPIFFLRFMAHHCATVDYFAYDTERVSRITVIFT